MTYREPDEERQETADREQRERETAEALQRAAEQAELDLAVRDLRGGSSGSGRRWLTLRAAWWGVISLFALGTGFASCEVGMPDVGISLVLGIAPVLGLIGVTASVLSKEERWSRVVGFLASTATLLGSASMWWTATHIRIPGGRPFRNADQRLRVSTRNDPASDWAEDVTLDTADIDPDLRTRLARLWIEEGASEYASVERRHDDGGDGEHVV